MDLHKRSFDRRTNSRPGTRIVPEETHNVHCALHKLGLCWYFRGSRMGVIKDNYPTRGRNSKHGTGFQNRCPVRGTMEPIVVFSTYELESKFGTLKIKKYHEVVNSAVMEAVVQPFRGERTPGSCMLTSVARHTQGGKLTRR